MQRRILTFLFLVICVASRGQVADTETPENHCITVEERELYNLISEYRISKNLPAIEFSKSLSYVAKIHAKDLSFNRPDFGGCNPHSWSDKGKWKSCCYARDEKRLECMTQKPKELTGYKHKAYEVVYSSGEEAKAYDAFYLWKDIGLMNDYLLNEGKWTKPWQAIGVGIYGEYACVWFGEGVDALGSPVDCSTDTINIITNPEDAVLQGVENSQEVGVREVENPHEAGVQEVENPHEAALREVDDQPLYYIIVSSTSSEELAIKEVNKIKQMGFPNALYIKNPSFYRIAAGKFSDEASAYREMDRVRIQYPDAWLLKPNVHK